MFVVIFFTSIVIVGIIKAVHDLIINNKNKRLSENRYVYFDSRGNTRLKTNNRIVGFCTDDITGHYIIQDSLTLKTVVDLTEQANKLSKDIIYKYDNNMHSGEEVAGIRFVNRLNDKIYVIRKFPIDFNRCRYTKNIITISFYMNVVTGMLDEPTNSSIVLFDESVINKFIEEFNSKQCCRMNVDKKLYYYSFEPYIQNYNY